MEKRRVKNYLSYGGGVNSTAMLLLLLDKGWDFEAVYVDHGGDWPESRNYVHWLSKQTPITILYPSVEGFSDIYEYFWHYRMVPFIRYRMCTAKFKIRPLQKHCIGPAYELIGIDAGEAHRAKESTKKGLVSRYPLVEYGIDRSGCIDIIKAHGLPVPMKSGCYFCPMQRKDQWKLLRRRHPDLFLKSERLEARNNEYRAEKGLGYFHLSGSKKTLRELVEEDQESLFQEYQYPPLG